MNKKPHLKILLLSIVASISSIRINGQTVAKLTVEVSNIETANGLIVLELFRENDDLPKKPFKIVNAKITNNKAVVEVEGLPKGNYAAIVYHDLNTNGILDHKFGFPNEPMGFSNNWVLSLFSGMPTFKKLKFNHSETTSIIIALH